MTQFLEGPNPFPPLIRGLGFQLRAQLIFFNGWIGSCIILKELNLKEFLYHVMIYSGNFSDIQMALRTDHFVDRTFLASNWSPTEQLVKGW